MTHELWGLLWSYLYVGAVVVLGESAARLGVSRELSRKIIHVGVGLWIFGTLALFRNPYMAVIAPLTSALGNYVIHRKRLLKAVEAAPDNLGTVYFPISFAILILLAWDTPQAVAGGVMAMTIGDAMASLAGERWGRTGYSSFGGARKSLQGSLAMLIATFVTLVVTLTGTGALVGVMRLSGILVLAVAGLVAVVATCAEGLGVKGRDNLWVPLSAGAVIYLGYEVLSPAAVQMLALGAVLALAIAVAAWLRDSLTPSGVLGAVLTGTLVFGLTGWVGGTPLVVFFVSSSLLSHLFRDRKAMVEADYAKSGSRDFGQTMANGGVAALAALGFGLTRDVRYLGALLGALAAANADTWATEVGVLSPTPPRLITRLQPVAPGTSGAISAVGTLAALSGAVCVGVAGAVPDASWWVRLPWIGVAGLAGSLLDSLVGATIQGVYWCPTCGRETERALHRCGTHTALRRGCAWIGNDTVNLLATLTGGLLGFFLTF